MNGQQKLIVDDECTWKLVQNQLQNEKIEHHTYGDKSTSQPCYIIKNISHEYTEEEIRNELNAEGFNPHSINHFSTNKQMRERKKSTMVKVVLRPGTDTKKFEALKYLFNARIYIEKMKSGGIVQCKNCQLIGHTSRFCYHAYRCIKCTDKHAPGKGQCKMDQSDNKLAPKCVNCLGDHIASSYDCPYIKKHREKISKGKNKSNDEQRPRIINSTKVQANVSFADATKTNNKPKHNTNPNQRNDVIKEILSQMQRLMTMLVNNG